MPLIKSPSKKAFKENVEAEMRAGKPKDQSLAIAYSVKRKAPKKKMAQGGEVNESAASERRPMPEERDKDSKMVSRNSGNKPSKDDHVLDQPTVRQAQKPSLTKLSRPKMVGSDAFSTRYRDEIEEDLHRMDSMPPSSPKDQPKQRDNEEGPNRQGPKVPDMQDQHNNHRKPYAKGGMLTPDHGIEEHEREDEAHMQSDLDPSEDEGTSMARSEDEEGQDRQGPVVPDMEEEHSTHRRPYAGGGEITDDEENMDHEMELNPAHDEHSADDSHMQPMDEEEEEHHSSIAAAIMAKKDRERSMAESGSHDMDAAAMYAEGGEIKSHDSIYSDDSDMADLSRNADEDANEEDQTSFNALRKENYSESEGLRQLDSPMDSNEHSDDEEMDSHDKHDMVSSIRAKMKTRKQFR